MPAYDHATQMAKLGHASLTLDELGYGASGRPPDGNQTCQGAEADVTHQIVQDLRRGAYTMGTGAGVSFAKVVLAGHDVGAGVEQAEAYSYRDVDALVVMTFADQGFTPWIIERETMAANDFCTRSPNGYAHFVSSDEYRTLLFHDKYNRFQLTGTLKAVPVAGGTPVLLGEGLFDSTSPDGSQVYLSSPVAAYSTIRPRYMTAVRCAM